MGGKIKRKKRRSDEDGDGAGRGGNAEDGESSDSPTSSEVENKRPAVADELAEVNFSALILARGGSRGVRLKNLAQVGGESLLGRTIKAATVAGLQDITVSTDHPLIALEALNKGGRIFHRSHVTASDEAPSVWGVAEFLSSREDIDVVVLLQATSPFTRACDIRAALELLRQRPSYDCIFAVARSFKLRWTYRAGRLEPINFKAEKRPRRQDWQGELVETGAFYVARRNLILSGYLQNNNCSVVEVATGDSLEVDSIEDLRLANILLATGSLSPSEC